MIYQQNLNQIKARILQGHTAFLDRKQIIPEHSIVQTQQPKLPTLQCFTSNQTNPCQCPQGFQCTPLLAQRIALLYRDSQTLQYTRQILIPFQRNENPITRRKPPQHFGTFQEQDTPTMIQLMQNNNTNHTNTQNYQNQQKPPNSQNSHKSQNSQKPPNFQKPQDSQNSQNSQDSQDSAAIFPGEGKNKKKLIKESERRLLLSVDAGDGEVFGGERLSAADTLRRLAYMRESEHLGNQQVERVWLLWIPRDFHRLAIPYRVFRANRDGLVWTLNQTTIKYITVPPDFFSGMSINRILSAKDTRL